MKLQLTHAVRAARRQQPSHMATILRAVSVLVVTAAMTVGASAQAGGSDPDVTKKLAALKEAAAANKQSLQQYTWTETQVLTLKGDPKPPKTFQCEYGPDGRIQKTPIGDSQQSSSGRQGGKLKQRIVAKKTEEMKDYMQQVQSILALYVPPDSTRMQRAYQAGNISMNKTLGSDLANIIFTNYAQQGDKMTVAFDTTSKKIQTINVNTYLDEPKDIVTLQVTFATLPDGTNYAQQTVLNATAKQLQVTTTNSNYAKRVQ
ncbi:hypothetical protein H7849_23585 [Alloacidobacterium dinghuense]|uniref:Outer membrane lipoprotein-sorting protein n=1 Tax=Alloacidobacterium dinghuense TaxID=2763107 RepID=A0A7G8BHE2_9BACT|nr:hypothetical protein [Alloacidobacterium dinghuense]QNI31962.1 hypothetical protein H7849_23585 [Alloacidobacterium dinghuense]